jgi:DUF3089 family protein
VTRRLRRRGLALALLCSLVLGLTLAAPPAQAAGAGSTVWLCTPDRTTDPCDGDLATTVQRAGKRDVVVHPRSARRHAVDCFYVYPTVSEEPTANASLNVTPPVAAIAEHQAARFSQLCDIWAPVYRQTTLTALNGGATTTPPDPALAYGDVLRAWREYRQQNPHRGVVLIGHSQGTFMLRQLIAQEIDPDPAARELLVSALLIGGNVTVRAGSDRGGDFQNVPVCRRAGQTGCVVAYSIYGETPPAGAIFGRTATAGLEVACTNPASLRRNRASAANTIERSTPFPGLIGAALTIVFGGPAPTADTTYVVPADRYTVQCKDFAGTHVLLATPRAGSRTLHPAPAPEWGLHLTDVNLVLGDLLGVVGVQELAYLLRR